MGQPWQTLGRLVNTWRPFYDGAPRRETRLYTWGTPNGRKVGIMLEECALPYRVHPIDITKGQQATAEYQVINPNGKIPAIVDPDGPDSGCSWGLGGGRAIPAETSP